jgi:hypothetical protein
VLTRIDMMFIMGLLGLALANYRHDIFAGCFALLLIILAIILAKPER